MAGSIQDTGAIRKHVMLSYQHGSQKLVDRAYNQLKSQGIPVWMDSKGGMKASLYKR